ncbi:MAG: hypothetical protein QHH19_07060 [Candidatus Thermoplasmatota archaeon]|jgi:hypothetical protein|nr:hypothetical protein [Candidatus Thermoplasmatota archaeon]
MRGNTALTILILILYLFSFTPFLAHAQNTPYNIIIADITYSYINYEKRGTNIIEFFNINITLRNLGANESDDITIELIDQDNAHLKKNHTFYPLEKKTFIFSNHPISGTGDHEITINFYPTDETKTASYNSGSKTVIINKDKSQTGSTTPGFEIILIIAAITLFIFLKKKNIL